MVSCSGLTEKDNHNKGSKYSKASNQASSYQPGTADGQYVRS